MFKFLTFNQEINIATKLKLINYIVKHENGKQYIVSIPKMSNKKLRETFESDAKSDGTKLKSFRVSTDKIYN